MTHSITLLTSAGAVRVAGENLVIDIREFQAKASEDNGSITGGAGAVTGEASRLASGRTDAGEAASVDLPTYPETPATSSAPQARQATAAGDGSSSPVTGSHSSDDAFAAVTGKAQLANAAGVEPSKPEACAGGPVSAQATPSKPIVHDLTLPAFLDRRAQRDVRHG